MAQRRLLAAAAALALAVAGTAAAAWAVSGSGPGSAPTRPFPATPAAPTVAAVSCTATDMTVSITWTAVAGATAYALVRTLAGVTTTTSMPGTGASDVVPLGVSATYSVGATTGTWQSGQSAATPAPTVC